MKKIFTLAAIALTVVALTVGCNSCNSSSNKPLIDTNEFNDLFDELDSMSDDMFADVTGDEEMTEADVEEEPAPATTKKTTTTTKTTTTKEETTSGVTKANIATDKKKATEVAGELTQDEGDHVKAKTLNKEKPKAADAFKKN